MKLCKDCKHFVAQRWISTPWTMVKVDAKCRLSDRVGDGSGTKSCVEERASEKTGACGQAGFHWEAK